MARTDRAPHGGTGDFWGAVSALERKNQFSKRVWKNKNVSSGDGDRVLALIADLRMGLFCFARSWMLLRFISLRVYLVFDV